jgi:transcriptional regulator with XRE-family HTH domain
MKIGDVIASFRRRKRIDQKSMAADLSISVSYLSQIENNSRMPSGKLLNKISDILEVPVSSLLFEAMDESNFKDDDARELFKRAKPMMDKMIGLLLAD